MNRILLVRLGALGDVVHAIPVAAALRRAFPSARIDWLVGAKHRAILDLVPVIDRRLVIDRDESAGGRTLVGMVRELRRSRYDLAIDLQGLMKSAALARSSGANRVLGFAVTYLRERLARPFYTEVYDPGCKGLYDPRETRHVVEINLGLLQALGIPVTAPEFPLERVESEVAAGVSRRTGGRYALLNPGAHWPNKRWPPERFGRVAAALRERHGLMSVALWGKGEHDLAEDLVAHAEGAAMASPPASIADLVALARGAAVMVSGDTGPAHIAAAVGTPIVGIFGPTRPSRNGPWLAKDVTVSRVDICQCHHLRRCRLDRMCLMDIGVEEVIAAIDRRLATESAHV
ncbi:MAG: glycosyltransferase family 9 protein [Acidobacteriota bacterium]